MLVVSRKTNDKLMIRDDIEITIVEIRGDKVRIGVSCPKEMPVHRGEVYEAICLCPRLASSTARAEAASEPKVHPVPLAVSEPAPATLVLTSGDVRRLDELRAPSGASREAALGLLLEVVDLAGVTSLCDLERRLQS